eukprot:7191412-Prymnesium_polylepis.1
MQARRGARARAHRACARALRRGLLPTRASARAVTRACRASTWNRTTRERASGPTLSSSFGARGPIGTRP